MDSIMKDALILQYGNEKDVKGLTWTTIADLLNEELGLAHDESTYRRRYKQLLQRQLEDVEEEEKDKNAGATYEKVQDPALTAFQLKKMDLEREKRKLQTEKLELSRWLRESARDELIVEKIQEAIRTLAPLEFPKEKITSNPNDKSYLLCYGDEHAGVSFKIVDPFGYTINEYSFEIFEKRMWELLERTIEIIEKENIKVLHVFSLGDYTDGVIRVSQLRKLEYGAVESTVLYSRFITEWLNELTKHVHVVYQQVEGNHSEQRLLGQPKGTFKEENLGLIVREFIKIRLADNVNFKFIENPTGNIFAHLSTHTVMAVHGDGVKNMEKTLKDYSSMYGVPIQYFICGHLHHSRTEEIGRNQEVINVPSIIATDPYSESLRKTSDPAAKLLVFEQLRGLIAEYRLKLLS